ncbi:MAG TPA: cbb3-type cytochrome c oxidase subunit 3 [Rhodocyclaceae bacterium]|nr:cbb3-type cytochrome c oxidase subunit 3 [Rhodocyclaceae bacterium]
MDINVLRSIITVVSFLLFIAIVCWAWSGRRKDEFEAAARLPLDDDKPLPPSAQRQRNA